MRNFSIQWLGLMMMLMLSVMVRTAPTTTPTPSKEEKDRQLVEIKQEASKKPFSDINVTKVSGNPEKCGVKFFCLAEKALEQVKDKIHHQSNNASEFNPEKLIRLLNGYNNMTGIVICDLKKHHHRTHKLTDFLKDVCDCAEYALQKKK